MAGQRWHLTFGTVGAFEPDSEKVSNYLERVDLFLLANGVEDDRKVATLLSLIGPRAYAVLAGLLAPATPKDKNYEQLIETLKSHYQPKSLVIAERFRFYKRSQGPIRNPWPSSWLA